MASHFKGEFLTFSFPRFSQIDQLLKSLLLSYFICCNNDTPANTDVSWGQLSQLLLEQFSPASCVKQATQRTHFEV